MTLTTTTTNPGITTKALKNPTTTIYTIINKTTILITITLQSFLDFLSFNITNVMSLNIIKPAKSQNNLHSNRRINNQANPNITLLFVIIQTNNRPASLKS